MSRIGVKPIPVPQGVKVQVGADLFTVEGPKGKLSQSYNPEVQIKVDAGFALVSRKSETKQAKAFHGLYRNLLNNMVIGVSKGYSKTLIVQGVGFKAEVRDKLLVLNLGYSTDFAVVIPQGISIAVEANSKVTVSGIDKQAVGQIASEIRSLRLPEPYKGTGIRYEDEHIRRKVGKSGVK